ncbi:hypothetical protein ASPVEDRAFT_669382 [Aspergillus versicolor CBS 583.65]|uniref:GTP cyclohydrolase 1 n=1 Tax=Aspergillus versicolor CBS 583.65 TaxID=1036611 RepID=A0A1L9PLG0_ASPVE|nr:uncharacterized protein ASPVEDRAFT_669382 [Aspergillus versicolor CBS 583.65]OJJ02364.1 hypothetical protein ASPVEDRAFT_669382 [Aspergillus versicolor CBS 583.65]
MAEVYSRRLQVQERPTQQVAQVINTILNPEGVAVIVECAHMCMAMRGVQKPRATTITQSKIGVFQEDRAVDDRFHSLAASYALVRITGEWWTSRWASKFTKDQG